MAYLVYHKTDEELKADYLKYLDRLEKQDKAEKKTRRWARAQLKLGNPMQRLEAGALKSLEELDILMNQQFFDTAKGKGRPRSTKMTLEEFIADRRAQEDMEEKQNSYRHILHGPGEKLLLDAAVNVLAS